MRRREPAKLVQTHCRRGRQHRLDLLGRSLAIGMLLGVTASCAGVLGAGDQDRPRAGGRAEARRASRGPTVEHLQRTARGGPVTVAGAGDVHAETTIATELEAGRNPLAGVARVLSAADIAIVNLETSVGSTGVPADKEYTFRAPPRLFPALASAGVDVVNLANNHALDFGVEPMLGAIEAARRAGLATVGAGINERRAYAPALIDVGGSTVAIVGLSHVLPVVEWAAGVNHPGLASAYDPAAAAAAVRQAARVSDYVVLAVHWGEEGVPCPAEEQLWLPDLLVEAGADVIFGHHPHVLQGIDMRHGAMIAYSLGNFLWYAEGDEASHTGVLTATLRHGAVAGYDFSPAVIDESGSPRPARGERRRAILATLAARGPAGALCSS